MAVTSGLPTTRAHGSALYLTRIDHVRQGPIRNTFSYRSYSWFVDLDALPELPRLLRPLASFDSRDHLGDPDATIRQNVDAFLAENDIDLAGGRITMLASARVFGHTFNPLSVYWCHGRDGGLRCVVAEVHNTYGERHRYLLRTDDRGAVRTPKKFYVSPFNDVDGEYSMRLPEPDTALRLSIVLERPGQPPFAATVNGCRREVTTRSIMRTALAIPGAPLRVVVQIRWQGIRLWARGLKIVPKPAPPRARSFQKERANR
ncbi:putative uncharacterized protein [Rhodococcus sp. AW25M09]|uniref:DUF1365 domain-containing protein n=1 Tax=Rhodococcus sp. AW25M09 TaxID=1268303 RepID=UPI0002ACC131|nr:DUF1365 domain-containing protein [Rhodococcus sp. AW25M09]CCQ17021.1 putative uncharacterized protein [Rhodococcus sp. AW25M09]